MAKFDIRKSFEIFWREPLSILKEGLFQIVNISTENVFERKPSKGFAQICAKSAQRTEGPSVNIDFMKNKTQITVVDSDKMYNLFQTVLYKKRIKESKEKALQAR